jgi:uncharacterized protein RhaS with RHS repeats
LSGLLSNNLDTIGHSKVCHPIQDRALEHQLFELIINLASLQPIAEDRLETEDLSLRQARYIAPDPIGLAGGAILYLYTHNPVNWIDPLGLTTWDCGANRWRDSRGRFTRRPTDPSELVI